MLKRHGRYDYSSIDSRPVYDWPNGTRLAVYVALNVEVFSFGEGKGAAIAPPDQAQSHSVYAWRDFGNRVGFWRMMDLFDALDVPIEAQLNSQIYAECPDIPERLRGRGDEILGHGLTNSDEQGHLRESLERAMIREATDAIIRHGGAAPLGWMSPWLSESGQTLDLLKEAGYRYVMDWACDDQPIWMRTRAGPILGMPYPVELNDNRAIAWYKLTADQFADMIVAAFDEMLAESKRRPLVLPISLHTFVFGHAFRIPPLRRALAHIAARREEIWLARPGDICRHIESLPAGIVPGG